MATFLTRGSRTNTLDRDATYVEHGFLPASESGQLKERKVVIREPLIVLAAARFTSIKYEPFHETLERRICSGGIPNGAAFENYLAICIDKLFSVDRRLDEIFDFGRSPPSWASRNATLVGLRRTNRHCEGAILLAQSSGIAEPLLERASPARPNWPKRLFKSTWEFFLPGKSLSRGQEGI